MNETQLKAREIFYPYYVKKVQEVKNQNLKFVQYTSAEAAMNTIKSNEVWLRNCLCMNDYLEVDHGLNCLIGAFRSEEYGTPFKNTLESMFPEIINEFVKVFDSWIPSFRTNTYIACVSEHPPDEDHYGRLSMWRAYGGDCAVAIVLNTTPFFAETDVFHAYTNPIAYLEPDEFNSDFGELTKRMEKEIEFLKQLGKKTVFNYLFDVFKNIAFCVKHPGFSEEREWRIAYNPKFHESKYIRSSIEIINGIPQKIYKIPLIDIPEENFYGATIPNFVYRIIIGPSDHQSVTQQAFIELLTKAGCDKAREKVITSGIPLR